MASCALVWHARETLCSRWILGLLIAALPVGNSLAAEPPTNTTAERFVREALEAEVAGDAARHGKLLIQAIQIAPNYSLARWHSGQIEVGNEWQPVEDAQQAAAADARLAEYRRLRTEYGDGPDGQLALARWCRRNHLADEARLHWASVLSIQPNHEEAQRALGVRWHDGRLMTHKQIDHAKAQRKESREAAKRWAPRIVKWQRDIADELDVRETALAEIRAIDDPDAIPALEEVAFNGDLSSDLQTVRTRQFSLAAVAALDAMPNHAATESLVRQAVFAPLEEVRREASYALKNRPLHDFVPLLLDGLAMPVESWFGVTTDAYGTVHYQHSLYREGASSDLSILGSRITGQIDMDAPQTVVFPRRGTIQRFKESDASVAAKKAFVAARSQQSYAAQAIAIEQQVAELNKAAATLNNLIVPVLASTTDQEFGNNPQAWWDWWQEYNEYYEPDDKPVYEYTYTDNTPYFYRFPSSSESMSCFAAGTLVWTKTGRRPIESLEIGELVLAQNPDTGELTYKPIIGRTVRPPSDILNMKLGAADKVEELHTTLGHPLWVAGVGWRMAKEVGDGAVLHGVAGPVTVGAIEPMGKAEACNLVVADFNTYFVGQAGVLVHDNTPRTPTRAGVPGLVADPVETAEEVAAK